jgi:hypothetical protein
MRKGIGLLVLGVAWTSAAASAVQACGGDDTSGGTPLDAGKEGSSTDQFSPAPDTFVPGTDSAAPDTSTTDSATACNVYDASGLDEASVQAGFQAVWQAYRCWGCHQNSDAGVDEAGNGITLSGNNVGLGDSGQYAPNLTPDLTTGLGCWTDEQIQNAILNEQDQDGGPLCSGGGVPKMPHWGIQLHLGDGGPRPGTPMDAGTAQAIIEYLRSLPAVSNQVPDSVCPAPADAGDSG